jgi:hypothetical protein
MTMAFSLKNKNRRICSAVHRAVSIRKLDSLPVNHPKPVIIVGTVDKHVRGAFSEKLNYRPILKNDNRRSEYRQYPFRK